VGSSWVRRVMHASGWHVRPAAWRWRWRWSPRRIARWPAFAGRPLSVYFTAFAGLLDGLHSQGVLFHSKGLGIILEAHSDVFIIRIIHIRILVYSFSGIIFVYWYIRLVV